MNGGDAKALRVPGRRGVRRGVIRGGIRGVVAVAWKMGCGLQDRLRQEVAHVEGDTRRKGSSQGFWVAWV